MMRGIATIRPGSTSGDIGAAIQSYVEAQHMSVVRDFCGTASAGCSMTNRTSSMSARRRRYRAQAGHVLHGRADDQSRPAAREGTVRRLDRGDARPLAVGPIRATVGVTDKGVEVFTFSPAGLDKPPYKSAAL